MNLTLTEMKTTGNTIKINVYDHAEYVMEPVMVKGKPTKRMKEVRKEIYVEKIAEGIEVCGHEVFIYNVNAENEKPMYRCYNADGSFLLGNCQYGRYGQMDHKEVMHYNPQTNYFYTTSTGFNGAATWRGHGAAIRSIEW